MWHEYFEQTFGEGCFLKCGKPANDPIHRNPAASPDGGCGPNCNHTAEEHAAFDAGVLAGRSGAEESDCPHYSNLDLREAWRIGWSVGEWGKR